MPTIQDFITRVVPWPKAGEAGFINLHWTTPTGKGLPGRPYTDVLEFRSMVSWCVSHEQFVRDVYFCLSRQSDTGTTQNGKVKALRLKQNALALKAIWLDIDVKESSYATLDDALVALQKFRDAADLPPPSALVHSGGGLHVYWTSDKELTPDEWRPYAEGLKATAMEKGLVCDYGLTTDEARVLRVPFTFNHKTSPPRQVRLLALGKDYDFAADGFPTRAVPAGRKYDAPASDPGVWAGGPKVLADLPPVEPDEIVRPPLAVQPLYKQCAFVREGMETGGEHYSQPMWNLSTLLATFVEDGYALAHAMGNRHAGYSRDSTDDLWHRKEKEK